MAENDEYFRGETLDLLIDLLDEDILDQNFEEDVSTDITEVR